MILNGVIGVDGVQLFGSVLSFLLNTDKQDHVNVPIIIPFCQTNLFACSGLVPLSCRKSAPDEKVQNVNELVSSRLSPEQRSAISNLITGYFNSMVDHLSGVRNRMNGILKSIKRQERTKGTCL